VTAAPPQASCHSCSLHSRFCAAAQASRASFQSTSAQGKTPAREQERAAELPAEAAVASGREASYW
jgi:hypothetical protein